MNITKITVAFFLLSHLSLFAFDDKPPSLSLADAIRIAEKAIAAKQLPVIFYPRSACLRSDNNSLALYYEIAYTPSTVYPAGTSEAEIIAKTSLQLIKVTMQGEVTFVSTKIPVEFHKPSE